MSVRSWTLPADAPVIDRLTLRLMKSWHAGLRDAVRSFWIVSVALAAATAGANLAWVGPGALGAVAGVLLAIAFPIGWVLHRRAHPVAIRHNRVASLVGGVAGVAGGVLLRIPVAVLIVLLTYGAPGVFGGLVALLISGVLLVAGWWTAGVRHRRLVGSV